MAGHRKDRDGRSYSDKLKDPRWQKKRLEVLERAGWACEGCKAKNNTLHVHHGYYGKDMDPWDYDTYTLWCLCEKCHEVAESNRKEIYADLAHLNPVRFTLYKTANLWTKENMDESERRGDSMYGVEGQWAF